MERVSTVAARETFSELVNKVAYGREPVVLTRRGRDLAMLCPIESGVAVEPEADAMTVAETVAPYGRHSGATTPGSRVTMLESRTSLAGLFASQTLSDVLRVLLLRADGSVHQRELARLTGAGLRSVQAETRRLEEMGLVVSARSGNRRTYSIDWEHPAAEDLRRLFARSFAVPEVLRDALAGFGGEVVAAFVYGSIARGEEIATSDVDLMVVGDVDEVRLAAALEEAERLLGRTVNATVYPVAEFESKMRGGNYFVRSVLEAPLVVVAGDLRRLSA
jgi:prevent-host-death family protein